MIFSLGATTRIFCVHKNISHEAFTKFFLLLQFKMNSISRYEIFITPLDCDSTERLLWILIRLQQMEKGSPRRYASYASMSYIRTNRFGFLN